MSRARSLSRLANESALSVSTDLNVGINSTSPVEKLNVVGVVSATSFFGDGTGLTGVASTDNIITGTAATFTGSVNVSGAANFSGITTVGILTAYTSVKVGSAVTITSSGIVSATSFDGSLNSSNLTGALPAIDGSALINLNIPTGFNELDAALFN
tara:strand:+ start:51 stop:518 length:468 start_codon:yes stop_codon:yes gene_type:complete